MTKVIFGAVNSHSLNLTAKIAKGTKNLLGIFLRYSLIILGALGVLRGLLSVFDLTANGIMSYLAR